MSELTTENLVPLKKARGTRGYPERFVNTKGMSIDADLCSGLVRKALCAKFGIETGVSDETLLIHDKAGYSISPHTDHPQRLLSAILYLAKDTKYPELGTSLYVPKDKKFRCKGGPHHKFEKFDKVKTVPYLPNSLFVFQKTDRSFHGVEKTEHARDVLLYDVRK